ncbi:MAG TPA: DNA alkylation repair protein [Oceanobacillus sp.]|nr:DNA alkylation repair protein [Oceanobacillus sp.]
MPDALKDTLYSRQSFEDVAAALEQVYPAFDRAAFFARIYDDTWEQRTLMQRMRHIPVVLRTLLPPDYREALEILQRAAPLLRHHGFHVVGFSEFIALYGLDDWEASLPALAYLTRFASSEFAVRPFILKDTPRMMAQMLAWAGDENEHVRRLAREGCRPRLPWGVAFPAFKKDPSPILPILERLKNDPSEYVRRSVANNLNDIAKDNPHVVIEVLRRWQVDADKNVQWIIQRALRSLVKAGHTEALALLGYTNGAEVTVKSLTLSADKVTMNQPFTLCAEIESQGSQPQNLVIDYVVYFMKANGKQAPKVFKLTKATLQPGETLKIEKKLSFQPITTRAYYAGEHAIALKINGEESQRAAFHLVL